MSFHDRIDLNRCNSGDPLRDLPHPEEGGFFFLGGAVGEGYEGERQRSNLHSLVSHDECELKEEKLAES